MRRPFRAISRHDRAGTFALRLGRNLRYSAEGGLPAAAQFDALHVALAAVHGMDLLLTWNCRHINNADTKPLIRSICARAGYTCPEICTPQELLPEENDHAP